ncbi:hypothetical protein F4809DRAFT_662708 [Biscogniauxia mediterranea]|nr:hypothetical protein F4809DRAFT_662708 [Biscogniauxia mediterranea]
MEIDEIYEEEEHSLTILEVLLEEFEPKVTTALGSSDGPEGLIEFLEGYWLNRMTEVLESLNGDGICEEGRQAARRIGVIWDNQKPTEISKDPYDKNTKEYWYYELDQIESEPPAERSSSMGR